MLNACWRAVPLAIALSPALALGGELATGVVVDGQRGAVFVMAAGGGLESLDVLTGQPAWSTTEATRPIASHAGRVLAQAEGSDLGRLRLLILDRGRLLREAVVELPAGAEARIDDRPGSLFRVEADQSGPLVEVRWTSERRELKGVPPEQGPERFRGRVRVDLQAVVIEALAGESPAPAGDALPASLAREAELGAFRERPRRMGALFVATQQLEGDGAPGLVLRRWDAQGVPLPAAPLPDGVTLQLSSDDGGHVLLSRRVPDAPPGQSHLWTVLSLDTGAAVAELRAGTAAAPFAVVRGRVLHVQQPGRRREGPGFVAWPLSVRAADAASGATIWSRQVRDTAYRGRWVP